MEGKPRKKRMGCLSVIGAIFLLIIIGVAGAAFFDSQTKVGSSEGTMTKASFNQIKDGMSYEEATAIIGGEGEVISESGSPGDPLHTIMYQYNGHGQLGANASLMFQGNKLTNKTQIGLE